MKRRRQRQTEIVHDGSSSFFVRHVVGNGDCMYVALACGQNRNLDPMGSSGINAGKMLRTRIAEYLRQGHANFNAEVNAGIMADEAVLNILGLKTSDSVNLKRRTYYDRIARDMYGDFVTIACFMRLFPEYGVIVYERVDGNTSRIISQNRDLGCKMIYLLNENPTSLKTAHINLLEKVDDIINLT